MFFSDTIGIRRGDERFAGSRVVKRWRGQYPDGSPWDLTGVVFSVRMFDDAGARILGITPTAIVQGQNTIELVITAADTTTLGASTGCYVIDDITNEEPRIGGDFMIAEVCA